MELPFQQVFVPGDLAVIGLLIVLEGVLSIDNALVLGLLAKRLPPHQRARALTYGLIGAFVFRFVAIATAQYLLRWTIVKLIGGGYLLYVAVKFFFFESHGEEDEHIEANATGEPTSVNDDSSATKDAESPSGGKKRKMPGFWPTVVVIELTDIAFAIDSILAAIALVGTAPIGHVGFHPKLWVVVAGGMLGVILMRFAAALFIRLLEKFPRFEISAYLLVLVIGLKLVADWLFNGGPLEFARLFSEEWRQTLGIDWLMRKFGTTIDAHPHALDFHSPSHWVFWTFWVVMLACLAIGFIPQKKKSHDSA